MRVAAPPLRRWSLLAGVAVGLVAGQALPPGLTHGEQHLPGPGGALHLNISAVNMSHPSALDRAAMEDIARLRAQQRLRRGARHPPIVHHVTEEERAASRVLTMLLFILVSSQYVLFVWKKRHFQSYQTSTLLGLWIFPLTFSAYFHFWRFCAFWVGYSLSTGHFVRMALAHPLPRDAPKLVYSWFLRMHQTTHVAALVGYGIGLMEFLGFSPTDFLRWIFRSADGSEPLVVRWFQNFTAMFLFYGLYFGVLTRDLAEVCTQRISTALGLAKKGDDDELMSEWQRRNICALCGEDLYPSKALVPAGGGPRHGPARDSRGRPMPMSGSGPMKDEPLFELRCKHIFHESCIRGWAIVGKQDTCPYCVEPVDLARILGSSPWQKQSLVWIHLLDAVRYLIVWHPIILTLAHFAVRIFLPHQSDILSHLKQDQAHTHHDPFEGHHHAPMGGGGLHPPP